MDKKRSQVETGGPGAEKRKGAVPRAVRAAQKSAAEFDRIMREFLRTRGPLLEAAAGALAARLRAGGKVLVFGNGGSAAEAQHFAAELVNGIRRRGPALPAVALTADTSSLTAIGNDRGFERVFSRQVEALGKPGDAALVLTTSGDSPNVVEAVKTARARGLVTIGLTGKGGGDAARFLDFLLDVPSRSTPRVQEAHLFILHLLAERLEGGRGGSFRGNV